MCRFLTKFTGLNLCSPAPLACSILSLALAGCGGDSGNAAQRAQAEQELRQLTETNQELQRLRTENQDLARLQRDNDELQRLRTQTADLEKLRQENQQLRAQLEALKPTPKKF